MTRVFLSYRRADTIKDTGRIYDRLAYEYGRGSVFKDVDNTPLGADFRRVITEAVSSCDVLLVVIGRHWAEVQDEQGQHRLDNPDDFVRIEVETGLQRDSCLVIPVLVDRASMPKSEDLPDSLQELTYKQAQSVRDDPDFQSDVERLIKGINANFPSNPAGKSKTQESEDTASQGKGEDTSVEVFPPAVERPVNLGFDGAVDKKGFPFGWFNSAVYVGGVSFTYQVGVEKRRDGQPGSCVHFYNRDAAHDEFGSLMQRTLANYLAGKTIRLVGELTSSDVENWAGFWLRADALYEPNLFFYNMNRNPVVGNRDWETHTLEAVLPPETVWLNFGIILVGPGEVWADNLRLLVWQNNSWQDI